MTTATVTLAAIRRLVVSTQGYAPRFRRAQPGEVEDAINRLSAVQLDSISTVDRAHRLTLTSRIGTYDESELQALVVSGRIFEYWAHEACLLPVELWPHFRRTMEGGGHWGFHDRALRENADLVEPVLERIRTEGPLASRDFGGTRTSKEMWARTPAKAVLEALWDRGVLVVAGRESFQRRYDLAERVIPRAILDAPTPDVDEGLLREVHVDDDGQPFYVDAEAELDGDPAPPVLLCPFDNLLWDRPLAERLFGFRHVMEIYKREHEREYGYYVLPLLAGDRIVGRADLKAERAAGILHVRSFHPEPRVRGNVEAKLGRAATRLARVLGLKEVRYP